LYRLYSAEEYDGDFNDELENICKKIVVAYFILLSQSSPEYREEIYAKSIITPGLRH
jgi:hypothetical protein